jgi:ABC-type transport system substrate-binding protein
VCIVLLPFLSGCGDFTADPAGGVTFHTTLARVRTLDPARASDAASGVAVGHLYDRLVQYDYAERPYCIIPAMAAAMPDWRDDGLTVVFRLRPGLVFPDDSCFHEPGQTVAPPAQRRVRARDVVFSLLRLADARVHSPGYWTLRGRLQGLDAFHDRTNGLAAEDFSPYDEGVPGLTAPDDETVVLRLTAPYPQLLQVLAMPYASVVPERAVRHYGERLAEHPVGSGPFRLGPWRRNHSFVLLRNPDYRCETVPWEDRPLPLADRVVCYIVQEPLSAWLLFLQGNLDMIGLTPDTVDAVLDEHHELHPDVSRRGIVLHRVPGFEITYIGFNLRDPLLGANRALRQAISLAYDRDKRMALSRGQYLPAAGPIPPNVPGYRENFHNPYARRDLESARRLLAEAGFPDGVDPATGRRLRLRFDLGGTDLTRRQQAELMVADMRELGIEIEPVLSNLPRFFEKIQRGDVQLFRLSWIGDYPDAQNFLQLFYGPNAGSCNRAWFRDAETDALYERAEALPPGEERAELFSRIQARVVEECPWIFENHPVSFRLVHGWVRGYIPHPFAWDSWKYLGIDADARRAWQREARPVRFTPRSARPRTVRAGGADG